MSEFDTPTTRRNLLKVGGLGLAGAAFLAACSDSTPVGISGGAPPTTENAPVLPDRPATEAELADAQRQIQTMASLEALLGRVYRDIGGKVQHSEITPLIAGFTQAHVSAAGTVAGLADVPIDAVPNEELDTILVQPRMKALTSEEGEPLSREVLSLLRDLESTLTATYINAVGVMLEPSDRKTFMAHGAASARRVTLLSGGGDGRLPEAVYPPTDLVPGSVLVDEEDEEGTDGDEGAEGDDA